jgi:hypothetical protein
MQKKLVAQKVQQVQEVMVMVGVLVQIIGVMVGMLAMEKATRTQFVKLFFVSTSASNEHLAWNCLPFKDTSRVGLHSIGCWAWADLLKPGGAA